MSDGVWHPCRHGLTPIAEAVGKVARPNAADTVKWLREGDVYSPLRGFQRVIQKSWSDAETKAMTSTRREMVRRWLQSNGFEADAREFHSRLDKLIDELRFWENQAQKIANGRDDWQSKERKREFVELVDIFGDENRDWFYRLTEEAIDTCNYLRQLNSTVSAKLAKAAGAVHRPDGKPEPAKPAKKRGRKPDTDAKADQRLADAWKTGSYTTHAELAKAKSIPTADVKLALDRNRKRRKK